MYRLTDRWTDTQIDREADRWTDTKTQTDTDGHTYRHIGKQTYKWTDRKTDGFDKWWDRQMCRRTDRQKNLYFDFICSFNLKPIEDVFFLSEQDLSNFCFFIDQKWESQ